MRSTVPDPVLASAQSDIHRIRMLRLCARSLGPSRAPDDVHEVRAREAGHEVGEHVVVHRSEGGVGDRKSTRLNSSHANISYAVFCLKKKKIEIEQRSAQPAPSS